jgi:hypothetical protein
MYKYKKPYTLAVFETGIFCSGGGRDDHNATPPGREDIFIRLDPLFQLGRNSNTHFFRYLLRHIEKQVDIDARGSVF